jgi:hsp70-interacting protein
MQSLLRWGIENSGNDGSTAGGVTPWSQRTDLDPGIIDAILGKPDSELMKEALAKAQDASLDEDARLTALDDLEMVNQKSLSPVPHPTTTLISCSFFCVCFPFWNVL